MCAFMLKNYNSVKKLSIETGKRENRRKVKDCMGT